MKNRYILELDEWRRFKSHVRRRSAMRVNLKERQVTRATIADLKRVFPDKSHHINVVLMSTVQWSSVVVRRGDNGLAFVDTEQANAINLLLTRHFFQEQPIFSYIEYMVRASEFLLDEGRLNDANSLTDRTLDRLREYVAHHGSYPWIPRPAYFDPEHHNIIDSNVILSFVIGHEVGHLLNQFPGSDHIFSFIEDIYNENKWEPWKYVDGKNVSRFIKPYSSMKFNENSEYDGDIIQSIKIAKRWNLIERRHISEMHADAVGVVAATLAAARHGIPPERLLQILFIALEISESLMILRRFLNSFPTSAGAFNMEIEPSQLFVRRFGLIAFISSFANRDVSISNEISISNELSGYWAPTDANLTDSLVAAKYDGSIESVSNRLTHLVRGGLQFGMQGSRSLQPSVSDIQSKYGILAGSFFFLYSFTSFPDSWFAIEETYNWEPGEDDPVMMGFGAAVRDISNVLKREARNHQYNEQAIGEVCWQQALHAVRKPRLKAFSRDLRME